MSKIVVVNMLSLDGYTEGPGGNVMAMPMDLAFDSHNAERLRAADSILFGGTTYRGMVGFWPGEVGQEDRPDGHRYIAQRYADGIPVTVVSDTVTEADTGPGATRPRSSAARTPTSTWPGCASRRAATR